MSLRTQCHTNIHQAIVEALQLTDIASIVASYSGSGDSGDSFEITLLDEEGQQISDTKDITVVYLDECQVWDGETKSYQKSIKEKSADLKTAIEDACWAAVSSSGEDGWENNEGGHGEYRVSASGEAVLSHTNFYNSQGEEEEQEFDLSNETFASAIESISSALKSNQVDYIQIDYEGEGDSGNVSEITVNDNAEFDPDHQLAKDFPIETSGFVDGVWTKKHSLESVTIATALEDLMWRVIDYFGNSGFENNEGGSGHLIVNSDGKCTYRHSYNNEEGDANEYELLSTESVDEEEIA